MQRDLRQLETEAAYERSELERCGSLPGYRYRCADEPGDVVAGQGPQGISCTRICAPTTLLPTGSRRYSPDRSGEFRAITFPQKSQPCAPR